MSDRYPTKNQVVNLEGYQEVFFIITYGLGIVILGGLATWKNRNPLVWGLVGGLFFPASLLCLLFEPHLCPKCRASLSTEEWGQRKCPSCGPLATRMQHNRSLMPAHAGTV
jgi:hypothetical protein